MTDQGRRQARGRAWTPYQGQAPRQGQAPDQGQGQAQGWSQGQGSGQGQAPPIGSLAVDTARDRVGVVMDVQGGRVFLRRPGGGTEWEALPRDVRPASGRDELRGRVTEADAESGRRWGGTTGG
jgi:hypothetical protein